MKLLGISKKKTRNQKRARRALDKSLKEQRATIHANTDMHKTARAESTQELGNSQVAEPVNSQAIKKMTKAPNGQRQEPAKCQVNRSKKIQKKAALPLSWLLCFGCCFVPCAAATSATPTCTSGAMKPSPSGPHRRHGDRGAHDQPWLHRLCGSNVTAAAVAAEPEVRRAQLDGPWQQLWETSLVIFPFLNPTKRHSIGLEIFLY